MADPFVLEIVLEVVKAIVGVAIPALTVYLAFYTKRINEKMMRKDLQREIDNLTSRALQIKSFEKMDYELKVETVVESAQAYAMRNDINFSQAEIRIMVESSFASLATLEKNGLQLYQLKLSKEKNGKIIEK